jgi:hypothetical protein
MRFSQASAFAENWRTSLDRSVFADAQGLLDMGDMLSMLAITRRPVGLDALLW